MVAFFYTGKYPSATTFPEAQWNFIQSSQFQEDRFTCSSRGYRAQAGQDDPCESAHCHVRCHRRATRCTRSHVFRSCAYFGRGRAEQSIGGERRMEIPRNAGSDASAKMSDRDECALQKGPLSCIGCMKGCKVAPPTLRILPSAKRMGVDKIFCSSAPFILLSFLTRCAS